MVFAGSGHGMMQHARQFFLTALIAGGMALLSATYGIALAQAGGPKAHGGAPEDWSHRHLLYTNPDTRDEAARKGTLAFERWKEKHKDPRFAAQVAKKARFLTAREGKPFSPEQLRWARRFNRNPPPAGAPIHRDWSVGLNAGTDAAQGYGKPGVFPAKFGFDINATPDCTNDFVVFPTTGKGATASASGSFTSSPSAGQKVTITNTNTGAILVLTASSSSNSGTFFLRGSASASATNLAAAIVRNGAIVGVTEAGATRPTVTVTALDPGLGGNSITLAETLSNFTWGTSALTGGADPATTRPTIEAFNNLYNTTCPATVPGTYWAFNTGAAFTETSPVLSGAGDQVAFVQRGGSNGQASLVLLKWSGGSGTIASPATPSSATAANYRSSCAAPCMLVMPFMNSAGVNNASPYHTTTNSSPFVDYSNDILYVGDDRGYLHKFTGVFAGTPAEVGTPPWPVSVSPGNKLSSPVYDGTSGLIFVGSASGATTGGQLHSVDATSGALVSSARIATNSSAGIRDGVIVDSGAGRVYAFLSSDRSGTSGSCGTAPCAAIYQFSTTFTGGSTGAKVQVGRGYTSTTMRFLYAGTFDNSYYTSATPASPSGNLYVCGGQATGGTYPTLWKVPINNNAMAAPVVGPRLVGNTFADCSGVTGVMNGPDEYLYASVTAGGNDTGCSGACIYAYNLTGLTWGAGAVAAAGLPAPGGTSGIIIDNISATAGTSQVYYSTLTSPGNAIQASQAGLN